MTRVPNASSDAARKRMMAVKQKDTLAEMRLRRLLYGMGLRYRVDHVLINKPRRKADIAFLGPKVAVFVDGCFWHGCPKHGTWPKKNADFWRNKIQSNQKRDLDSNHKLAEAGWHVIRVWEHDDVEKASKRIAKEVRMRS